MWAAALCFALTAVGSSWADKGRSKDVKIDTGTVRGYPVDYRGGQYFAFLGIPYASPPTFKSRFKAPRPPQAWNDTFRAKRTVMCPQKGIGDEDCLIVNVFTPAIINELVPVLVYVHGGSFFMGKGQTRGVEPLMRQKIIVVTLNYRLGVLGFLCLGTADAPGNAGLKDQVAALQWVQTNIMHFKGDPSQVTLYGMSAGAGSVALHMLPKMSRGLFKRAIVESSSATSVSSIDAEPISTALKFVKMLKNHSKSVLQNLTTLVKFLQSKPAKILTAANDRYHYTLTDGTHGFAPCIENQLEYTETFISESPHQPFNYSKIPVMFLYATIEGLHLKSYEYEQHDYKHKMDKKFKNFLPADLVFYNNEEKEKVSRDIKKYYFGRKTVANSNVTQYFNYFGDYLVMHGLLNAAETWAREGAAVYLMEFKYKGKMANLEKSFDHLTVAGHGDVVKYAILNKQIRSAKDRLAVERISKLIGNFVNFGEPTPSKTQLLPRQWPRYLPPHPKGFQVAKRFKVFDLYKDPVWRRKLFWDNLYSKYRRNIYPVVPQLYPAIEIKDSVLRALQNAHGKCELSPYAVHVALLVVVRLSCIINVM